VLAAAALAFAVSPAFAAGNGNGWSYEMASPQDKNGGEVSLGVSSVGPVFSSPNGNVVDYFSPTAFADPTSALYGGAYEAVRGTDAWRSRHFSIASAVSPFINFDGTLRATSKDLSHSIFRTDGDPVTGERQPRENLVLRDNETGSFQTLTPDPVSGPQNYRAIYTGGSADFSVVFFATAAALTPDAVGLDSETAKLYRWQDGTVTLASITPDPPPPAAPTAQLPALGIQDKTKLVAPVSTDGSVYLFQEEGSTALHSGALFRVEDGRSEAVNASENTLEAVELGAARDVYGTPTEAVVAFISNQRLVDGDADSSPDVYLYDHREPVGERLTLVSADAEPGDSESEVSGIAGVSADGNRVYFGSPSQLVSGGPLASPTDTTKLYAWDATSGTRYIATVEGFGSAESATLAQEDFGAGTAFQRGRRVTADGRYLAFGSGMAGITAESTGGFRQIFRYDIDRSTALIPDLVCVSCRTDGGVPAHSAAMTTYGKGGNDDWPGMRALQGHFASQDEPDPEAPNTLLADGTVIFQTTEALIGRDTNGTFDVYAYRSGAVELITSGRAPAGSLLGDVSDDGRSIFFGTAEKLVGWDRDGLTDLYVARLDGAFPEPSPPTPACEGDGCQAAPPPAPPSLAPASAALVAPGDSSARRPKARCRQGQRRVKARNGKTRCGGKRPAHRKHRHHRSTGAGK
jgi:hypothetical protein